jgi:ketosteroid isomerase-like protein
MVVLPPDLPHDEAMSDDLAALAHRVAEAASCVLRGDLRRYFELLDHTSDFTLMGPYGGEPQRGADRSEESAAYVARTFQGGEVNLEVVQAHASGDLAVLVVIERQRGRVGGLPEQDWSLRVTLVFRREDGRWALMHRHADALTHPISHEILAGLARGDTG